MTLICRALLKRLRYQHQNSLTVASHCLLTYGSVSDDVIEILRLGELNKIQISLSTEVFFEVDVTSFSYG